jgi:DNA-binding NtrC family response regulator
MVPVNCGALPESLLESELFGHEKGAFTGAQVRRKGKIEMADGGTLFLDEIGTISLKTQVNLLRVLESKEFTRLGGSRPIKVDFRVICATNEDLEAMIGDGRFRHDLYYRLNVFEILLPPLRERREDIPLLAKHFLARLSMQMDKRITEISPEAMRRLVSYDWPGNVRELANAIERAMVVGRPPVMQPDDLPLGQARRAQPVDSPPQANGVSLADVERDHIARVLDEQSWNISRTADLLGIDRTTLYNKIKKYEIHKPGGDAP